MPLFTFPRLCASAGKVRVIFFAFYLRLSRPMTGKTWGKSRKDFPQSFSYGCFSFFSSFGEQETKIRFGIGLSRRFMAEMLIATQTRETIDKLFARFRKFRVFPRIVFGFFVFFYLNIVNLFKNKFILIFVVFKTNYIIHIITYVVRRLRNLFFRVQPEKTCLICKQNRTELFRCFSPNLLLF